jgi:hypothetical protein
MWGIGELAVAGASAQRVWMSESRASPGVATAAGKMVRALTQAYGWSSHAGRATRCARAAQRERGYREPVRVRQMRAHG